MARALCTTSYRYRTDMIEWTLTNEDRVSLLTMTSGENKVSPETLDAWDRALDAVEGREIAQSLIITGEDHYWSTGLDLDVVETMSPLDQEAFMIRLDRLLGRLLTAPFVTIAALNGHAYAAGALLALACDYRVMRNDRGFFCLPSVDIGIPFSEGMTALITGKLPQTTAHDLVISCRRIGAQEAMRLGVVNRAEDPINVLPVARQLGYAYGDKDPGTLGTVKHRMYADASRLLSHPA